MAAGTAVPFLFLFFSTGSGMPNLARRLANTSGSCAGTVALAGFADGLEFWTVVEGFWGFALTAVGST